MTCDVKLHNKCLMPSYSGFLLTSVTIEKDCSCLRCSFVGLRDGCINLEEEGLRLDLRCCCFIDNCVVGRHGGAVCITGRDSAGKVTFCYASSCYTCPVNEKLAEGQFLFVSWNTPQVQNENYHELSFLSVSQCAPLIHDEGNEQRAPIYAGEGTKNVFDVNISRSFAQQYNILILEQRNNISLKFITCFNCTSNKFSIGFRTKNSIFSHTAILHPLILTRYGGFDMMTITGEDNNNNPIKSQIFFSKSFFLYDVMGSHFGVEASTVTLESCKYVNLNVSTFNIYGNEEPDKFTNIPIKKLFIEMGIFYEPKSCRQKAHNIMSEVLFLTLCKN